LNRIQTTLGLEELPLNLRRYSNQTCFSCRLISRRLRPLNPWKTKQTFPDFSGHLRSCLKCRSTREQSLHGSIFSRRRFFLNLPLSRFNHLWGQCGNCYFLWAIITNNCLRRTKIRAYEIHRTATYSNPIQELRAWKVDINHWVGKPVRFNWKHNTDMIKRAHLNTYFVHLIGNRVFNLRRNRLAVSLQDDVCITAVWFHQLIFKKGKWQLLWVFFYW